METAIGIGVSQITTTLL